MNKPQLDPMITGQMKTWGGEYDSDIGCSHNTKDDKISPTLTSKDNTLNIMSEMDASHAKPKGKNPGVDKAFLAKAAPSEDNHGKLSRSCQD